MKTFSFRALAVASVLIGSLSLASCASASTDEIESTLDDLRTVVDAAASLSAEPDMPGLEDEKCDDGTKHTTEWNVEIDRERTADIDRATQDIIEAHGFMLATTSTTSDEGFVEEKTFESGDVRIVTILETPASGPDSTFILTADTGCR